MKKSMYFLTVVCLCLTGSTYAQMTARVVADNLFIPWEMVYAPDNHIWFTQKNGYICRVNPKSSVVDTLYHESNVSIISEGGMLGMVLHPDFPKEPYVYVAYNYDNSGNYQERIVRYTYTGSALSNPQILLDNIQGAQYHNGCRLAIANGHLFITTGDATTQSIAQDVTKINGKILRINLNGTIPSDNPISGSPIWSWGHRNAQGLVYAKGRLYSSEHGPKNDDELNIIQKGRNYGWPNVQGYCNTTSEMTFCNDSNVVEPLHAWTPTLAVSGLTYYDHPMFPELKGSLLMNTLKDTTLYQLQLNSTGDKIANIQKINAISGYRLRAICIDPDGRIYVSTSNSKATGLVDRIDKIIELYDPNYSAISNKLQDRHQLIAIHPNPTHDVMHVFANIPTGQTAYQYTIINAAGQLAGSGELIKGYNTLSTSAIPAGVYWLNISSGSERLGSTKFQKL